MAEEKRGYQTTTSEYHGQFGETINRGTNEPPGITPEGVARRLDRLTILDARDARDYDASDKRIPASRRIDPDDDAWAADLPKESWYVLYCSTPSEATCSRAAKRMIEMGFEHVNVLVGGWQAWVGANLPVVEKVPQGVDL
jgi:rhodanese-related sulfurtransferase